MKMWMQFNVMPWTSLGENDSENWWETLATVSNRGDGSPEQWIENSTRIDFSYCDKDQRRSESQHRAARRVQHYWGIHSAARGVESPIGATTMIQGKTALVQDVRTRLSVRDQPRLRYVEDLDLQHHVSDTQDRHDVNHLRRRGESVFRESWDDLGLGACECLEHDVRSDDRLDGTDYAPHQHAIQGQLSRLKQQFQLFRNYGEDINRPSSPESSHADIVRCETSCAVSSNLDDDERSQYYCSSELLNSRDQSRHNVLPRVLAGDAPDDDWSKGASAIYHDVVNWPKSSVSG